MLSTRIVGQLNYQDGWDDATWQSAVNDRALVLFRRLVVFGRGRLAVCSNRAGNGSLAVVVQL
jgi:hypothetical protein